MEYFNGFVAFLENLSSQYGSGDLTSDLIVFLLAGAIALVLLVLFRALRGNSPSSRASQDGFDRLGGIAGKLERLEMNTNAFQTEVKRELEFLRSRIELVEKGYVGEGERSSFDDGEEPSAIPSLLDTETQPVAQESASQDAAESEGFLEATELSSKLHSDSIERTKKEVESPLPVTPSAEQAPVTRTSLLDGLQKTRKGLFERIRGVFSSKARLDEDMLEELQALLVSADLGVALVNTLIDELKEEVRNGQDLNEEALVGVLKMKILKKLEENAPLDPSIVPQRREDGPLVVMMVGVNGVGKTTTTAKLAHKWKESGANVLMVAADTFRAAAVQQLCEWGSRIDVPVIFGPEDAKPSTVVFDAMKRAEEDRVDVVIIDTAGRLHTKSNLMQELEGVRNVVQKHLPSAPHESILVVDGTTGQNAVSQAREFHDAVNLTGLVVTKLDGTPKGGIVVAVKDELGVPIRYIGIGESTADLKVFSPRDFSEALFDTGVVTETQEPTAHAQTRRKRRRRDTAGYASQS